MSTKRLCDLVMQLHHETEKAIFISPDGDPENAEWVPKSVCEYEERSDGLINVTMPEQTAIDKGFV